MWNSVVYDQDKNGPCSRSKHSVTLLGNHLYVLAGRNGNVPLKDFWRFDLATNKWELLKPSGDCPPSLQEHTAVPFRDNIYVFGGELGFSAGNETPLWVYESKKNSWRKMRGQKGASVPKGRRGHTTLVHRGSALIYGGYCDLRGSSNEVWIFHFDTESWHLLMNAKTGPAARHKHSSVLHDDNMWVYGGMTDLQERSDLWRFDLTTKTWFAVKCKFSPGPLHSHAACKLPSSMLLFGGERNGQLINELWRFHFGTETWQRIRTDVISPQPISECCAVTVSELLFQNEPANVKVDVRNNYPSMVRRDYHCSSEISGGGNTNGHGVSVENCVYNGNGNGSGGNYSSSHYSSYVSRLSGGGGASHGVSNGEGVMIPPRRQATTPNSCNLSFLKEISKISQMNLSRLTQNARCSYHALGSNESLNNADSATTTTTTTTAAGVAETTNDEFNRSTARSRLSGSGRWSAGSCQLRDVYSLVNTPLTPSDAAKLVYLEGEEAPVLPAAAATATAIPSDEFSTVHQRLHPSQNRNRRSYPLTNTVRFANPLVTPEQPSPDITSDYASCENIHKLLSSNNRLNSTTNCDRIKTPPNNDCSVISFSNPNYFSNTLPTTTATAANTPTSSGTGTGTGTGAGTTGTQYQQMGYVEEKICRGDYVKLNSPADSLLEDSASLDDDNNKYEMTELRPKPPKSLPLRCAGATAADMPVVERRKKYRACSAGRYERERQTVTSLCVFLIGGKDHSQMTTFKRPISVWRLSLTDDIY